MLLEISYFAALNIKMILKHHPPAQPITMKYAWIMHLRSQSERNASITMRLRTNHSQDVYLADRVGAEAGCDAYIVHGPTPLFLFSVLVRSWNKLC